MKKFLILIGLMQKAGKQRLLHKLIKGMVLTLGLMLVLTLLVSSALIAILVFVYFSLLTYGVEQTPAFVLVMLFAMIIIALLFALLSKALCSLRSAQAALGGSLPIASHALEVVRAFTNGLMTR